MHHISLMMLRNDVAVLAEGSLYLQSRIRDLIVDFGYDVSLVILWCARLTQQLSLKNYIHIEASEL